MQINLEFMSVLAEFEQNCHLPEHMKEWVPTYTYFLYPVISCDKIWTTFFTFSRIPFHILLRKVSEVHIKFVSQYSAKIKIIRSSGKMAVVVQDLQIPVYKYCRQCLNFMAPGFGTSRMSALTPMFLWLLHDFVNVHAPQQHYCHSELSVETFRVLWCVLMQCFA